MILIVGGTTEGRMAAEVCDAAGTSFYYSTKGAEQDVVLLHGDRLTGAMDEAAMARFCAEHQVRIIVDAAHPFASAVHATIARQGLPVIRLQRRFSAPVEGVVYCADWDDAILQMRQKGVRRLLALSGVNTIAPLRPFWQVTETYFRILNRPASLEMAASQGVPTQRLLFYPDDPNLKLARPTQEQECRLMQQVGCDAILTKESGDAGGFLDKVQAALALGLQVFVVRHPELPSEWIYVTGRHGLRRAIEQVLPDFFPLRTGLTTGACATAAVKAALLSLLHDVCPEEVSIALPDDEEVTVPVQVEERGVASVVKDFSDDPDVTRGCRITARVEPGRQGIRFLQGEGVGRVTLPGLGLPVGEPAINLVPRRMMQAEIRLLTTSDIDVTLSVEHGKELAQRTFNPRVGVVDGISIIGTSGIVSPLSNEAFVQSIQRELQVAKAIGCDIIGLASGKRGEEALMSRYPTLRVIHYGNLVGETLRQAHLLGFRHVVLGILIGKAVKLAEGHLDTHSHKVTMNPHFLRDLALSCGTPAAPAGGWDAPFLARELWRCMPSSFFQALHRLCLQHCRTVFPSGDIEIHILCDEQRSGS